jgi:hypothetical protein
MTVRPHAEIAAEALGDISSRSPGQLEAPGNHLKSGEITWEIAAPRLYSVGAKGS